MTTWTAPAVEQTLTDCIVARRHNTRTGAKGWAYRGADGRSDATLYATFGGAREAACRAGYRFPTMGKGASLPYAR